MHEVVVLANADCPHCRHALDTVADVCVECGAAFSAVDLARHPEEAAKWHFETSPIVVLDGKVAFTGAAGANELRRALSK